MCALVGQVFISLIMVNYYDDQAVEFRVKNRPEIGSMYIYQGSLSSKKQIELPYVIDPQIVELTEEEAGIQGAP